jgi:hypothetical protein
VSELPHHATQHGCNDHGEVSLGEVSVKMLKARVVGDTQSPVAATSARGHHVSDIPESRSPSGASGINKQRKRYSGVLVKPCVSCVKFLCAPFKWLSVIHKRWNHLSHGSKEIIMFIVSNLIGTCLFLVVFHQVMGIAEKRMKFSTPERQFTISYIVSYMLSIIWQHTLNLYLLPPAPTSSSSPSNFCAGLLQAYYVYGLSLICSSLIGSLLLRILRLTPGAVSLITLPIGGMLNFYLLKVLSMRQTTTHSLRSKIEDDGSSVI